MKLLFLGTGSAFTMKNYHTNYLIQHNGKNLLFDCGSDIRFALKDSGLSYKDVNAVYVSHLHADHCGGVETLAFCTWFDPKAAKIQMFGNGDLLRKGWNNSWKGGLESVQGQVLSLQDYFDVTMVCPNGSFNWEGIDFQIVQSVHIMNGYAIVPTYGLIFNDPDTKKRIYLTGDTQFNPRQIMDFYKEADVIVQDCETLPFCSGVHANFTELCTLPIEIRKKMICVHYQDNIIDNEEFLNKFSENNLSFATKGETIEI